MATEATVGDLSANALLFHQWLSQVLGMEFFCICYFIKNKNKNN
jgi:hypothetical protein